LDKFRGVVFDLDNHDREIIKQYKYWADFVPRRLLTLSHTTKNISKMELEELTGMLITLGKHYKLISKKKENKGHAIIKDIYENKNVVADTLNEWTINGYLCGRPTKGTGSCGTKL